MRLASIIIGALIVACLGCTSASYKAGVRTGYPAVADRINTLSGLDTPAAANLKAAATDPITFGKASKAWKDAEPTYRQLVNISPNLTDHRRADWSKTADLLDQLNADEAKHESLLWLAPAPASLPIAATQPAKP